HSTAITILMLRSTTQNVSTKTKFIKDEPKTAKAPIAIGTPVKPSIAVNAIELNGAVATTVMTPPRIIPITTGFASVVSVIMPPIFNKVASTNGSDKTASNRASGVATTMITIQSSPSGTLVSNFFTIKDMR